MCKVDSNDTYRTAKKKKMCIACKYWERMDYIYGKCTTGSIVTRFNDPCKKKGAGSVSNYKFTDGFKVIDFAKFETILHKIIDKL